MTHPRHTALPTSTATVLLITASVLTMPAAHADNDNTLIPNNSRLNKSVVSNVYTMQRILFGDVPEKLGHSHDLLPWERVSYVVLIALVFIVGFFPVPFLGMINAYTSASFPWLGGL